MMFQIKAKNKKKIRPVIFIIIVLVLLLFSIPTLFYILKFSKFGLSNNVEDWALFGNYLGGVLTPVISFLNLIILGYITYLVGKNSNEENKNLFDYKKKIEAYDKLTSYFPLFNATPGKIERSLDRIIDIVAQGKIPTHEMEPVREMNELFDFYSEFYYFLFNYDIRYGHHFKYEFGCDQFQSLMETIKEIKEYFEKMVSTCQFEMIEHDGETLYKTFEEYGESMSQIVNNLRKEL